MKRSSGPRAAGGALHLERVLRRDDDERLRKREGLAEERTCRSCIASRSADCVFGVARLICPQDHVREQDACGAKCLPQRSSSTTRCVPVMSAGGVGRELDRDAAGSSACASEVTGVFRDRETLQQYVSVRERRGEHTVDDAVETDHHGVHLRSPWNDSGTPGRHARRLSVGGRPGSTGRRRRQLSPDFMRGSVGSLSSACFASVMYGRTSGPNCSKGPSTDARASSASNKASSSEGDSDPGRNCPRTRSGSPLPAAGSGVAETGVPSWPWPAPAPPGGLARSTAAALHRVRRLVGLGEDTGTFKLLPCCSCAQILPRPMDRPVSASPRAGLGRRLARSLLALLRTFEVSMSRSRIVFAYCSRIRSTHRGASRFHAAHLRAPLPSPALEALLRGLQGAALIGRLCRGWLGSFPARGARRRRRRLTAYCRRGSGLRDPGFFILSSGMSRRALRAAPRRLLRDRIASRWSCRAPSPSAERRRGDRGSGSGASGISGGGARGGRLAARHQDVQDVGCVSARSAGSTAFAGRIAAAPRLVLGVRGRHGRARPLLFSRAFLRVGFGTMASATAATSANPSAWSGEAGGAGGGLPAHPPRPGERHPPQDGDPGDGRRVAPARAGDAIGVSRDAGGKVGQTPQATRRSGAASQRQRGIPASEDGRGRTATIVTSTRGALSPDVCVRASALTWSLSWLTSPVGRARLVNHDLHDSCPRAGEAAAIPGPMQHPVLKEGRGSRWLGRGLLHRHIHRRVHDHAAAIVVRQTGESPISVDDGQLCGFRAGGNGHSPGGSTGGGHRTVARRGWCGGARNPAAAPWVLTR